MKKISLLLLSALLAWGIVPASAFSAVEPQAGWLDAAFANKGMIGIRYDSPSGKNVRAKVVKEGVSYSYAMTGSTVDRPVWLPLQMGDGTYTVTLLENVIGNRYKVLATETVQVKLGDATDVFLNSVQNVNWAESKAAVEKASKLVSNAKTDERKARAIYAYVIGAVKYDNVLAKNVAADYLPNIDLTLSSGKAVCYGYSALFAAMLRSQGIPAKMVMGTTNKVAGYHAWNEVYLNGKWIVVDTTVDAGLKKAGKAYGFVKSAKDYKMEKIY